MNITMTEARLRPETHIDLLELVSMEGRYYMARFYIGDDAFILVTKDQRPVLFTSSCDARDAFHHFHIKQTEIIPPAGTDEMVGMTSDSVTEMRVRL
ncbi:hypothetical protein EZI54_20840 [Marinobacter halodurans]|uniref:Uncharacterized protein n=1 Tax=Marinobacter halodurans TaxID=2528979 RepID=A0ABY1ZEN4_9GAMM|nr:DUF6482 family protein [Marinobacter halodurans]TBW48739.1 hypothetical protein EZI54_20840 [Marinobacter halodurans]